jgi:uncharacterized protein DUF4157
LIELLPQAIAWAERQEKTILQHAGARALSSAETETAKRAGVEFHQKVRILVVGKMPLPNDPALLQAARDFGLDSADGLTYGYGIFIRENHAGNAHLIAHELRHVAQVETCGGLPSFVEKYLGELGSYGYDNAPLELDAEQFAQREFPSLVLVRN